jgi:hypothetical protein
MLGMILVVGVLTACERPATISNWNPIETSRAFKTPTATATVAFPTATMPLETTTAEPPLPTAFALPASLPKSAKGYELYSWQNGSDWNFTLITGTNRTKSFDEIIAPGNTLSSDGFVKLSVTGLEEIKKMLALLPSGEQVFWAGMDLTGQVPSGTVFLTFPPQNVIQDLTWFCTQRHITLQLLKEP